MMVFVIDACAMIAFLNNEAGAQVIESLLRQAMSASVTLFMHKVNLLEIYYGVYRESGDLLAQQTIAKVTALPIHIVDELTDAVFYKAGRLKALYKISLADSIAAAEAKIRNCALVTADHHELDPLDQNQELKFLWFR